MNVGHIHGRFQPFHEGHLQYAEWAAENCEHLIVGITNADPSHTTSEDADPERHKAAHNPLRYHERERVVRRALDRADVQVDTTISPFPINRPELWEHYAPEDAIHFVYVLEDWHEEKVDRLRDRGRTVEVRHKERDVHGYEVRQQIAEDGPWRDNVPEGTAEALESVGAVSRIAELAAPK